VSTLHLRGCQPEPLAAYLSALGVLRLVSEQVDPEARGYWAGDGFVLASSLDADGLVRFFLEDYAPTPIVAPWNGGSGFWEGDRQEARDVLRSADEPRFAEYRGTLATVCSWPLFLDPDQSLQGLVDRSREEAAGLPASKRSALEKLVRPVESALERIAEVWPDLGAGEISLSTLEERDDAARQRGATPEERAPSADALEASRTLGRAVRKLRTGVQKILRDDGKVRLQQLCRARLPDRALAWLDAAVAVDDAEGFTPLPLLGTGGNEGRLDYTNNFMQRLVELLDPEARDRSARALRAALFGGFTDVLSTDPIGQYDPGAAGGYNQGPGIEHKDTPINPWRYVLLLEGAVSWSGGVTRRFSPDGQGGRQSVVSPFTVRASAVGYGSAAPSDEAHARAELWLPLWERPLRDAELRAFLAEGRAEVGARRARTGVDLARAAATLGVDRGVTAFQRYGLLKRRGDSYVALPAGRFDVREREGADLVGELEPFLARVDRFLRGFPSEPPARLRSARRQLEQGRFAALERGGADRLGALLRSVGALERLLAERDPGLRPAFGEPWRGLSVRWVAAAGGARQLELRLAAALASIRGAGGVGPLRANLEPVDPAKPWAVLQGNGQRAWRGRDLIDRLGAVMARRVLDARREGADGCPTRGALALPPEDAQALLEGHFQSGVLEDLLFGCLLIDWSRGRDVQRLREELWAQRPAPGEEAPLARDWCLLKLACWPEKIGDADPVLPDGALIPLLRANRVGEATALAARRLRIAGLSPFAVDFPPPPADDRGRRLAAALLVPVSGLLSLRRRVLRQDRAERPEIEAEE